MRAFVRVGVGVGVVVSVMCGCLFLHWSARCRAGLLWSICAGAWLGPELCATQGALQSAARRAMWCGGRCCSTQGDACQVAALSCRNFLRVTVWLRDSVSCNSFTPKKKKKNVNGLAARSKRRMFFASLQKQRQAVVLLSETHCTTEQQGLDWVQEGAGPGRPWQGAAFFAPQADQGGRAAGGLVF